MPKLYEIPAGSKFKLVDGDDKAIYKLFNVVNMSTHCEDGKGKAVNVPPWVEVELIE